MNIETVEILAEGNLWDTVNDYYTVDDYIINRHICYT